MNLHIKALKILTAGSLILSQFSINSVASPLNKSEILSILTKSSTVKKVKKKKTPKQTNIVVKKTVQKEMPKMKNNPYENNIKQSISPQNTPIEKEIIKPKRVKLAFGKLPNISKRAVFISEKKTKVPAKKSRTNTLNNNFDSTKYLEALFN